MGKIENDHQLKITAGWLVRFTDSVKRLKRAPLNNVDPRLRKAEIDGQESQIETFIDEIRDYLGDFLEQIKNEKV